MADGSMHSNGGFRLDRLANGWLAGRFEVLEAIGVPHLVTTREGPDIQRIRHDPARVGQEIARILGLRGVAFLEQVHGGQAIQCDSDGEIGQADGLATTLGGLGVMGKSADCPIVLIAEKTGRAVGFAHASWRSTLSGIVPAVIDRLAGLHCEPNDLVACICPSAGPECYEVGQEVREVAIRALGPRAAAFFQPGPGGKDHFDLWKANVDALIQAGIDPGSIHVAGICTLCQNHLFPSYRREGASAGRFAAVIGKTPTNSH